MKGSAKISTSSGVAQAGPLMGIWCDGKKWRARPSGYKGKDGEKIEPKAKQKRMDRDDVGALHQLDNVVRDALMAVLFDKRMYGWIGQQSGSGFINIARPTLGVFASLDRF